MCHVIFPIFLFSSASSSFDFTFASADRRIDKIFLSYQTCLLGDGHLLRDVHQWVHCTHTVGLDLSRSNHRITKCIKSSWVVARLIAAASQIDSSTSSIQHRHRWTPPNYILLSKLLHIFYYSVAFSKFADSDWIFVIQSHWNRMRGWVCAIFLATHQKLTDKFGCVCESQS